MPPEKFRFVARAPFAEHVAVPSRALGMHVQVMPFGEDAVSEGPTDGVYIHGLFMEGARFDRKEMLMAESVSAEVSVENFVLLRFCLLLLTSWNCVSQQLST